MSGIEVAGLVLGGIPLLVSALELFAENCETIFNYQVEIENFKAKLILQKREFDATLEIIGLYDPSFDDLQRCLKSKFPPNISGSLLTVIREMENVIAKLKENLGLEPHTKPEEWRGKVNWEWKRVTRLFTVKKRHKVIEELRRGNDNLKRHLERAEVPAEDDNPKVLELIRRFNPQRCDAVRQCLNSLHRALTSGFRCNCPSPHRAAIDLDWSLNETKTESIILKVAISYRKESNQPTPQTLLHWRKLYLIWEVAPTDPKSATKQNPQCRNDQGLSPLSCNVLPPSFVPRRIGKRAYSPLSRSNLQSVGVPLKPIIVPEPLPIASPCDIIVGGTGECSLTDYNEDHGRNFLLKHNNDDMSRIVDLLPLKPLYQLLGKQNLSNKLRCGIAAYIAWSVLHLSDGPWLNSSWDEKQAKIFLEACEGNKQSLSERPCFDYIFSDPLDDRGGNGEASNIIQQPNKQPGFVSEHDHLVPNLTVFAVGILLVELCLKKPFVRLPQEADLNRPQSLLDRYSDAVRNLGKVYNKMGHSYGYAAERCIKTSFSEQPAHIDFSLSSFRRKFYNVVVAPVQATYINLPG